MTDQKDFYSSKGVFLSQLYALSVLRSLSPKEAAAVVRSLSQSQ